MEHYNEISKRMDDQDITVYQKHYSETKLISKILNSFKKVGTKLLNIVVTLFYTLKDPDTPKWAKTVIYGALGYFIFPLDVIPDFAPVVGYADDLWALTGALGTVALYVKEEHKRLAKEKINKWMKTGE
jgi:uncharacterized membrane protein YkvA (DUF1232 family)